MPGTKDFKIDTSKPVLVTGATGYVAGVLIAQLLDKGLTVHATVRDPSKKDRLQYLQDLADKSKIGAIKFFKANLLEKGSFDEAAKGCSVIFHTASPFAMKVEDPYRDLIEPAVHGTENVLTTASNTPTVKRVVLTSSCMAIYAHASDAKEIPNGVFNEDVWNRNSKPNEEPYPASKTMAEQKAWVIAGSQTQWTLVTINPGFVMGPGVKYHPTSESFDFLKMLGGGPMKSGAPNAAVSLVDVRDVAAAHIAAAYIPEAQGRHVLVGHDTTIVGMGQAIAKKYPPPKYPVPNSGLAIPKFVLWLLAPYVGLTRKFVNENVNYVMVFDNTKAKQELGIDFYPLTETMQDMYQQLLDEKVVQPTS